MYLSSIVILVVCSVLCLVSQQQQLVNGAPMPMTVNKNKRPDSPHPANRNALNWKLLSAKHWNSELEQQLQQQQRQEQEPVELENPMPKRLEKSNIISHSPLKRPDTPDPRNPDAVNWDFYRETNNLPAEVELALLERELKGKSKYHSRSSTFSSSTATSSSSAKSSKAVGLPPVYPSKSSSTGGSSLVRRHDEATPRLTISSSTSSPDNGGEPIRPRRQRTQAVMLTLDQLGNTTSFEDALFVSQLNVQNRLNQQPTTDATTVPPLDVTIPRLPSTMQRPRRQRTFAVSIPMERMVDLDTFNSPIINAFAREE